MNSNSETPQKYGGMHFNLNLDNDFDIDDALKQFVTQEELRQRRQNRLRDYTSYMDLKSFYLLQNFQDIYQSECFKSLDSFIEQPILNWINTVPEGFFRNPFPILDKMEIDINGLFKSYKNVKGCEDYEKAFRDISKPVSQVFDEEFGCADLPFEKLPNFNNEQKCLVERYLTQVTLQHEQKILQDNRLSKKKVQRAHQIVKDIRIPEEFEKFLEQDNYNMQIYFPRMEAYSENRTILPQQLYELVSQKSSPLEDLIFCGLRLEEYQFIFNKELFEVFDPTEIQNEIDSLKAEQESLTISRKVLLTKTKVPTTDYVVFNAAQNLIMGLSRDHDSKGKTDPKERIKDVGTNKKTQNTQLTVSEISETLKEAHRLKCRLDEIKGHIEELDLKLDTREFEVAAKNTFHLRLEMLRYMSEFHMCYPTQPKLRIKPFKISRSPLPIPKRILDKSIKDFLSAPEKKDTFEILKQYLFCPDFDPSTVRFYLWLRSNKLIIPEFLLDEFTGCVIDRPVFSGTSFFDKGTLEKSTLEKSQTSSEHHDIIEKGKLFMEAYVNTPNISKKNHVPFKYQLLDHSSSDSYDSDSFSTEDEQIDHNIYCKELYGDPTGNWFDPVEQKYFPKKVTDESKKELVHFLSVKEKVKDFLGKFYNFLKETCQTYEYDSNK